MLKLIINHNLKDNLFIDNLLLFKTKSKIWNKLVLVSNL